MTFLPDDLYPQKFRNTHIVHCPHLNQEGEITIAFWDRLKKKSSAQEKEADPCDEKEFAPRYQQKKINVFVSSTFRDMVAERDELTLRVFPALRKICEGTGHCLG